MRYRDLKRYDRQIGVEEIGLQGQRRLMEATVLVIGAGGLGCPLLYSLAGAGIGTIRVVDGDEVSFGNLNRQFLYQESDVGRQKAVCACEKLNRFNSDISFVPAPVYVDGDNIGELTEGCSLVFLAVDNMETRFLVNDVCMAQGIPLINGGVDGFSGNIMMVEKEHTPCLRCMLGSFAKKNKKNGGIGAVASVVASCMANLGILYLIGVGNPVRGLILLFDGLTMQLVSVEIKKNRKCPVCIDANVQV